MPDLDSLIADACAVACRYTLKEVFAHLRARGFRDDEILNGVGDVFAEEGHAEAARLVENAVMLLPSKPREKINDDDLSFL
ncbi:hypothetical protein SD81_028240 [Tolypothrix campylonemoides VB511288]|nr:hypothetical protein SD81_028240 [Tolypothrix campylonemoides VB511288]